MNNDMDNAPMNIDPTYKLKWNHPVIEVYPDLTHEEIEYLFKTIKEKTAYKTGTFPIDVFHKYYYELKNKVKGCHSTM